MEILAPAGNRAALERARAAGADAVYLGFSAFSARSGAGNFNEEELAEAIRYAHLRHMRVYVTVNTLVKDGELPAVRDLLRTLSRLRADGILVQDLGILRLARTGFPSLPIHASTQMAVHNAAGVRWCARQGMRRVVLARDCGLETIRACAEVGPEIEVFGHGAQCVSVSGECLLSSMAGGRSGNRGRCAQPCRKLYRFDGKEGAWLSPRDLCLRDELPALSAAGAASVKLEGRLKRPEYVYIVAESYVRGRDGMEAGRFRKMDEQEKERLAQAFNRGGFMRGYAFGDEDAGVIQPGVVHHQGLPLGRVESAKGGLARIRLERDLHDGDGIRLVHGGREADMTYAGKETSAGDTAVVRLREGVRAWPGDPAFRLTDEKLFAAAREAQEKKIPLRMEAEAWPGKPLTISASDGEREVRVFGETVEPAQRRETTAEEMEKQLRKTGGTPFEALSAKARTAGAFVPVSAVNELRREALSRLAEERIAAFAYPGTAETAPGEGKAEACGASSSAPAESEVYEAAAPAALTEGELESWEPNAALDKVPAEGEAEETFTASTAESDLPAGDLPQMAVARTAEQAEAARNAGLLIIRYPEDFRREALEKTLAEMKPGDWLRLPEVCGDETLEMIREMTERFRSRLGGVMLGSVGQMGATWPVPVAAGPGIPIMNREAARSLLEAGCRFVVASPELTGAELKTLTRGRPPIVTAVYGRTALMILTHCPARTAMGLKDGHALCRMCDGEDDRSLKGKALEDELGHRFPLLRQRLPEGCRVRLMNDRPTDWLDQPGIPFKMIELTGESPAETEEIVRCLREGRRTEGKTTRGHWARGVE